MPIFRTLWGAVALVLTTAALASAQVPSAPPDVATPPADAVRLPSGLATKVLEPATGDRKADASDLVTLQYTMWTTDGKLVDSTAARNTPARFPLTSVFPGFRECVTQMLVGEHRRCWAPQAIAYKGQKGRPAGMIVFDVELVSAEISPTVAPADVAKAPDDVHRLPNGLAYKVLESGYGVRRPISGSTVTVHYTGWTTAGKMFDSSVMRGQPTTFNLDDVIKGWSDGVQTMVEGEKTRFWIPEPLAYEKGGGPKGMLVFDIELIRIDR